MKKVWMSWSTGKDSAFALSKLLSRKDLEVTGLFTTITETFGRVSMHSTREVLLEEQAARLSLPLHKIKIPSPCSNEIYENKMRTFIDHAYSKGIDAMAFGDLFLQDIKDYRIKQLKGTGIEAIFPLWNSNTKDLAKEMVDQKYKAILTCIDEKKLDPSFSGRTFDSEFLAELPEEIDPCGENGEFHSFVYNCPLFSDLIPVSIGKSVSKDGFRFTDVTLSN